MVFLSKNKPRLFGAGCLLQQLFFQGFDDFQSLVLIRDELLKFFGVQRTIGSGLDGEVRGFLAEHVLVVVDLREIAAALIRFGDGDGAASATVCVGGIVDANLITTALCCLYCQQGKKK